MSKIFVGLSGGVDSAVSAALLQEQGHEVVGCFIKIWQPEFIECTWREDRLDAMRVCAALGVPFREVDFSDAYKKEVVDTMVAAYERGATPNPDVRCNRSIKFGHFMQWALKQGADMVATGHYARIHRVRYSVGTEYRTLYQLLRGKDANKDQSYFLWQLGQKELARSLFPLGGMAKREVRALAKSFNLPNAEKPDSQGLCFAGDVPMGDFLARFIALAPGPVVDMAGGVIGEHRGAALYTIGERHGFTVRGSATTEGTHYVVAVDTKANTVRVSAERSDALRAAVRVQELNWIGNPPELPREASVQARYREKPATARIEAAGSGLMVSFAEPHLVASGQSLVIYDGETCLGGGVMRYNAADAARSHHQSRRGAGTVRPRKA